MSFVVDAEIYGHNKEERKEKRRERGREGGLESEQPSCGRAGL